MHVLEQYLHASCMLSVSMPIRVPIVPFLHVGTIEVLRSKYCKNRGPLMLVITADTCRLPHSYSTVLSEASVGCVSWIVFDGLFIGHY